MITITTTAGIVGIKPGDIISYPTPNRRWWQLWKPRITYNIVTAIATDSDDDNE